MKSNLIIKAVLIFIFTTNFIFAQQSGTGSITVNGTVMPGEVSINQQAKTIAIKSDGTAKHYDFSEISSLIIADQEYKILQPVNADIAVVSTLVSGNASVYKDLDDNYYLQTNKYETRKLNFENPSQIRGTLAAFFSDCESVRNELNGMYGVNSRELILSAEQYNICDYSEGFVLSEEEYKNIEESRKDIFEFFVGAGYNFTSMKVTSEGDAASTFVPLLSGGIMVSPSFFQEYQKKLYFTLFMDFLSSSRQKYPVPNTGKYEISSVFTKMLFGFNYRFNEENTLQPYVGFHGGVIFSDYNISLLHEAGVTYHVSNPERKPFFVMEPEVGFKYNLSTKYALGLSLRYTSSVFSTTIERDENINPLQVKENGVTAIVRFYF